MLAPEIYIDSSVWNAALDAHVPNHQAETNSFFDAADNVPGARLYISDVVLAELGQAPEERAPELRGLIERVEPQVLELDDEAAALAEAYISHGVLTGGHRADAQHVAIASVARMDVLVSWNYRHLVNRRRREAFNGVNALLGYAAIEIISPPEVFDVG